MKAIQFIKSEDVIAIDIETVRIEQNYFDLPERWQSAWEYKNKQLGKIPTQEELAVLWEETASLYPEFAKVCAVSLVFFSKGDLKCKSFASIHEPTLLKALAETLVKFRQASNNFRLIGHAAKFFDYPFLCKRMMINGIPLPAILDESDCKPWEMKLLCTNELWKSFGTTGSAGSSLQALCTVFDIPVSKVDLVGDEVGAAYFRGEIARIGSYCNLDTIATYNLLRKFKGESIFEFDEVIYVNEGEVMEAVPFLVQIRNQREISKEQGEKILSICKDLTASEISNLKMILSAAILDDQGEPNESSQEFINTL